MVACSRRKRPEKIRASIRCSSIKLHLVVQLGNTQEIGFQSVLEQATSADLESEPNPGPKIPRGIIETDNRRVRRLPRLPTGQGWPNIPAGTATRTRRALRVRKDLRGA